MKGLMIKDFYLGRRFLILSGIGFILMISLSYLFRFAFVYGNLATLDAVQMSDSVATTDIVFSMLPGFVMLFICEEAVDTSIFADARTGWNKYMFSGGLSEKRIVLTKYIEFLGLWFIGVLLNLLFAAIYGGVFGFSNVKNGVYLFFLVAMLVVLCQCIIIPLAYRYKNENAVAGRTFIAFLLPGYLLLGFLEMSGIIDLENMEDNGILDWCKTHMVIVAVTAVLVILAAVLISYSASLKIVSRREALCGD